MAAPKKMLVAMDFDNTIVNEGYYTDLLGLVTTPIPEELQMLYNTENRWTDYMNALFAFLHSNGVEVKTIRETLLRAPLVSGMRELLEHLQSDSYDIILVSDSTTLFIDWCMTKHEIGSHVARVYSNPASIDADGKIVVQYYQNQDKCKLSSRSLCKGNGTRTRRYMLCVSLTTQ